MIVDNKDKQDKQEEMNSISIGSISLSSSSLNLIDLISITKGILNDETFRNYLNVIKLDKLSGNAGSYCG